jgi:protein-L-isoaspartate(D-aspartate) O-methyltransferase
MCGCDKDENKQVRPAGTAAVASWDGDVIMLIGRPNGLAQERERMVAVQLRARGIRDERVLAAMTRVPRHEFVPSEFQSQAYEDHPLPIGQDQTISQPYIVAVMLAELALGTEDVVLEVGTGSGYVTALLAELAKHVYSVERHASLAKQAEERLQRLNYTNVKIVTGDGNLGLPEEAPFDEILVSAAATEIPRPLFEQLKEGGRMMIPVGSQHAQQLQLVQKENGELVVTDMEGCRFVPLVSGTDE